MTKSFRAILIDPDRRTVEVIDTDGTHESTSLLIDAGGLDHFRLADHGSSWDYGWIDDTGLSRGDPVYAFKFDIRPDPLAGRCLLLGVDKEKGNTIDVSIPVEFLRHHIEWLGKIVPEVTWDDNGSVHRAIITYAKAKG